MSLSSTVISDRRGHDRHPIHTQAWLMLADGRQVLAETLDVGKGGAAIVTDVNPALGSRLRIRMNLPARPSGSAVFEADASVANCILAPRDGGFRVGLQFGALSAEAQAALKGCLP